MPIELRSDGSSRFLNLKSSDVVNKVIFVSDPGRVHRVSQFLDDVEFEVNQREFITHKGRFKGEEVMVVSTGMGADNIEIVMLELDGLLNYDFKRNTTKKKIQEIEVIRLSSAGAIQNSILPGDSISVVNAISLGTLLNFYELEYSHKEIDLADAFNASMPFDWNAYAVGCSPELLERMNKKFKEGNVLSCPGFYAPMGRETRIAPRFKDYFNKVLHFHFNDTWITHMDMETAAFYGMARVLGHKAICLLSVISDRLTGKLLKDPNKAFDKLAKSALESIIAQ